MRKLLYFVNKWPLKNSSTHQNSFFSILSSFQENEYYPVIISQNTQDPQKLRYVQEYSVKTVSVKPNDPIKLPYQVENIQLAVFDSVQTSRRFSYDIYNKYNKIPQLLLLTKIQAFEQQSRAQSLKTDQLINREAKMWPDSLSFEQQSAITMSDTTIVMSQFLYHHLRKKHQNVIYGCEYLPTQTFIEEVQTQEYRPFNRRKNFYFIGNLSKRHNQDCVERLLQIWDLIRKQLPSQQLHIYSRYYSPQMFQRKKQLAAKNIIMEGQLQESEDISKYRMLLAPFRYHVDSPGKIIEAWFYHTPVVTTPFGSQSLFQQFTQMSLTKAGKRFLNQKVQLSEQQQRMQNQIRNYYSKNIIGEDDFDLNFGGLWRNYTNDDFAKSVISLSKDQNLWNKCRRIGQKTIITNHSQNLFKNVIGAISNSEYKRVTIGDNSVRKQTWDSYLSAFAKQRKANKKGR